MLPSSVNSLEPWAEEVSSAKTRSVSLLQDYKTSCRRNLLLSVENVKRKFRNYRSKLPLGKKILPANHPTLSPKVR